MTRSSTGRESAGAQEPGSGLVLYVIQHRDWSGAEAAQADVIAADPHALVACPEASPTSEFVQGLGARTTDLPFRSLRHSGGSL